MKRLLSMICLLVIMTASMSVMAQEIMITLNPGWTWVSYPRADTLDLTTAVQFIPPTEGDLIKSQTSYSVYLNGQWIGSLQQLVPGEGLMYKSMNPNTVNFVFGAASIPSVTTSVVTQITQTTAIGGGEVIATGGEPVTERGICWGTSHNPTTNGNHISSGTGTGTFTVNLVELTPYTTYYVRAYAINDKGTAYGNEVSFITELEVPLGAITGKFTINENGDQVFFSQGNLQYIGSATMPYWKFAENQWDYFGTTTGQNSSNPNVDRDLFGWGTSGYDHGAVCYQPYSVSSGYFDYDAYGGHLNSLYDQTGQADWGYNAIINGGNQENMGWRTLKSGEWYYIYSRRTTLSGMRYALAKVNSVNGLILLPDDWDASYYPLNEVNHSGNGIANYNSNVISATTWFSLFQQHGAVFLPAAGVGNGDNVGDEGHYWSSTCQTNGTAYDFELKNYIVFTHYSLRYNRHSVRLVIDVE